MQAYEFKLREMKYQATIKGLHEQLEMSNDKGDSARGVNFAAPLRLLFGASLLQKGAAKC